MLSPNLVSPKGKAASIWSIDSGYGSNTLEDEDALHVCAYTTIQRLHHAVSNASQLPANPGSSTAQRPSQPTQRPIGLGIQGLDFGGFWNVHVEDKLRLRRLESPANPITTKLNVFTTRDISTSTFTLPALSEDKATCITCQLWDLTNPGQGLKCDGCKSRDYVRPGVLHLFDTEHPEPEVQTAIPRLDIPKNSKPRHVLNRRNEARCSACELAHAMDPETSSTCASCTPGMDLLSPGSPILPSTVKRSCARRHTKLPSHVLHRLRTWLRANRDHPYPNAETKRALAQECGITEKQVTTWFTNTRARKLPLPEEPSHTSSEDEGTYESDYSSITNTPVCTTNPAFAYGTPTSNPTTQAFFGPTSYSTTQLPLHTFSRRGKKKDYRRVKTVSPVDDSPVSRLPATPSPNPGTHEQETWQCTFCQQHLVPKSWRRHEETQHRPKYQWTCLATSPRIVIPSHTGTSSICAFCQLKDPSEDHLLRSHRIVECSKKSEADRTFGRPDHLRQHIKNFHKSSLLDMVRDTWRRNGPGKNVDEGWTCGFCQAKLNTWDARETHIANHFKDGLTMAHWQDRAHSMAPAITENTRRSSHEEDTSMLAKLKTTLMGRPAHYSEQQSSPHNHIPATFDSPCPSTSCSNMSIAPLLPDFANMDFGEYMPDEYMNNFDFAGPSTVQGFDGSYMAPDNTFCNYVGDEALQMDLNAIVDPELYGNVMDFQSLWDTQRQ
jgi:hypothetical protein